MYQPSRRFVYGFSLSRETFQLFLFDRSGPVQSSRVNIHRDAKVFVGVVRLLSDPDLSTLGFDPAIFWDKNERYVEVNFKVEECLKVMKFKIEHILFRARGLYGRGTVCWIVRDLKSGNRVVMKDSWRSKNCKEEVDILSSLKPGEHPEIGRLEILLVDDSFAEQPLSTASIRADQCVTAGIHNNRVFSRILLELRPSIRHFQTGLQLLQGLRDAVQCANLSSESSLRLTSLLLAHYHLVKAGILHRDICPDHILLVQSDGGPRAVLVGFRNAVYCDKGKSPDTIPVSKASPTAL